MALDGPGRLYVGCSCTTIGGQASSFARFTDTAVGSAVAIDDSATVAQHATATALAVLDNDTDVDAGPMAIVSATDPANGSVTLTGAGPRHTGLTYTPDPATATPPAPAPRTRSPTR